MRRWHGLYVDVDVDVLVWRGWRASQDGRELGARLGRWSQPQASAHGWGSTLCGCCTVAAPFEAVFVLKSALLPYCHAVGKLYMQIQLHGVCWAALCVSLLNGMRASIHALHRFIADGTWGVLPGGWSVGTRMKEEGMADVCGGGGGGVAWLASLCVWRTGARASRGPLSSTFN